MVTTSIENPATFKPHTNDVLVLRNNHGSWLLEIVVYTVVIGICTYFAGAGIYCAMAGIGSRLVSTLVACAGLAATWALLTSALKRYQYYQDCEPKLTLSTKMLRDHRTDLSVPLENVTSIRFDRRIAGKHECRADLHLSMDDGTDHVFNLLGLDQCSKEIAWRVKNFTGVNDAEGVSAPNGNSVITYVIATAMFIGILWQVFIHARSLAG